MQILLTNDDGIYAPGLAALYEELRRLGNVQVVAPAFNQSGVAHSITHLRPLLVNKALKNNEFFGWEVEGSPADCVKLAILELCDPEPDVIVSGINGGANAGINVLYSGTVAAAIEGAFYGVTSIAVSLTMNAAPDFSKAARLAVDLIPQILEQDQRSGAL
ncbi:MAG: 5'/3'-nucleotidase SurE, partial [Planctomycetales bacterium]